MTLPLITTPMYFDTVLKALEQLLKDESVNQIFLGGTGWETTRERFDPWNSEADGFPLVNVSYNTGSFDESKGSQTEQTHDSNYIVDCYSSANALKSGSDIIPKDQRAADALHFFVSQIYYTLMSELHRDIGLPAGMVVTPWVNRIEKFVPTETGVAVEGVIAARLSLSMSFREYPPVFTGVPLEIVRVDTDTDKGGLVEQQFDTT